MDLNQKKLERLHQWKQTAVWSPVLWLPLAVYWLLTDRTPLSIGFGLAGLAFVALARVVVWSARCPRCETQFRASPDGFRRIWNDLTCETCKLSLFELRRGRAQN